MIKAEKALEIILHNVCRLAAERVPILSSLNRVLAEDIYSGLDLPSFDNSAMDGFALRSGDTKNIFPASPGIFEVIETVPAGYVPKKYVRKGRASRIMTGAPVPKGADAVIMAENTKQEDGGKVAAYKKVKKNENIRFRGEDIKKGARVLSAGRKIRAVEIGLLAALNIKEIKVFRQPVCAILATGDELVDLGEKLRPGQLVSSNNYNLSAQVTACGGLPRNLGIAADKKAEIKRKIEKIFCRPLTGAVPAGPGTRYPGPDMLIISGGISVGDYDLVKAALKEMGVKTKFWRVVMKPGKPLYFGLLKGIPVFGLPGNPAATVVCFERFIKPALLRMQGKKETGKIIRAICTKKLEKAAGKRYFIRGMLMEKNGEYYVTPVGPHSSGVLSSLVRSNCLIILPEEIKRIKKGGRVDTEGME